MPVVVKVVCKADGNPTPHGGRYVVTWYPHTDAGEPLMQSTDDIVRAKRWPDSCQALEEWRTISNLEPVRPWDGQPNRPLTGLRVEVVNVEGG